MKEILILHTTPGSKSKKKVPPSVTGTRSKWLENRKKLTTLAGSILVKYLQTTYKKKRKSVGCLHL
jgi:hypothetical protein